MSNMLFVVVPHNFDTKIFDTSPIGGDFVLRAEHRYDVAGVLFFFVSDYKVVNDKAESDGLPFVHEQTGCVIGLLYA